MIPVIATAMFVIAADALLSVPATMGPATAGALVKALGHPGAVVAHYGMGWWPLLAGIGLLAASPWIR